MIIFDLIDDRTKQMLKVKYKKQQPNVKRKRKTKTERSYSQRQLENMMGVNRDRYHKVNGKVKRK